MSSRTKFSAHRIWGCIQSNNQSPGNDQESEYHTSENKQKQLKSDVFALGCVCAQELDTHGID